MASSTPVVNGVAWRAPQFAAPVSSPIASGSLRITNVEHGQHHAAGHEHRECHGERQAGGRLGV